MLGLFYYIQISFIFEVLVSSFSVLEYGIELKFRSYVYITLKHNTERG